MTILGEASDEYLTINPGLNFNGVEFYACYIVYKQSFKRKYIVFGKKCGFISEIELDKLIKDIIDILKLCEKKITHNDIKLENIMYCGGKYKLIDWGNATFYNKLRGGVFTGPLKYYLCGGDIKDSVNSLPNNIVKLYPEVYNSELFKTTYKRIYEDFMKCSEMPKSEFQKTYNGNHDLFALGITIIQIVITKQIDPKKYIPLINFLTSYTNPPTISELLRFMKNQ
jgi:serine/threonine protein kinase